MPAATIAIAPRLRSCTITTRTRCPVRNRATPAAPSLNCVLRAPAAGLSWLTRSAACSTIEDHAQTQFSIDNQPVTDQQSRVYSNQIHPEAVQPMEIITGVAPAEVESQPLPGSS
jgi:hypothetical protein